MFSVVTFFVFLFRVLHDSWGQELGDVEVTNETLARQWLDVYNRNKGKVYSEYVEAVWNSHTNLTAETNSLVVNSWALTKDALSIIISQKLYFHSVTKIPTSIIVIIVQQLSTVSKVDSADEVWVKNLLKVYAHCTVTVPRE